ncbi:di-trans,poly-cis-decaprenylcistransferase, partial [Candidatus Micrarchaeota archaeon]|nr:di-trans,poly-cis-decaprenylcistransferase [Candidatus Micrarchaeota archaeon]
MTEIYTVNRRWGELKGIPKKEAYAIGIRKIGDALKWCRDANVEILTMWGFSTDNFTRDKTEISDLFELFKHNLKEALESDDKNRYEVRVRFLGRLHLFPREVQEMMKKAEEISAKNTKNTLNLLLAYGGREEIITACKQLIEEAKDGRLSIDDIDEALFSNHLYTKDL